MKPKKLMLIIFSAILLSSCGSTTGLIGNSMNTDVHLKEANFKVLQSVSGEATAMSLFGIGVNQKNLYEQAKRDMINKANLIGGAKTVINITADVSKTGFIFWHKKTVYVSAEVIEFYK